MTRSPFLTPEQQADLRASGLVADVLGRWIHPDGGFDLLPLLSFENRRPRIDNNITNAKEAFV